MSQMVKSIAVLLVSSHEVQSLMNGGLYKITGPDSITASCMRAARALVAEIEAKKPSGMAAKLAGEFFACNGCRNVLNATNADFRKIARESLARAEDIERQVNAAAEEEVVIDPPSADTEDDEPSLVNSDLSDRADSEDAPPAGAVVEATPAEAPAGEAPVPEPSEEAVPGANVEPTPAAGQVDVPSQSEVAPAEEAASEPTAEKPADVPVEELIEQGIPSKVIEVLVAAGLTTAKQVRDRDTLAKIDDLQDIGTVIRGRILAAVDSLIA